MSAPFITGDTLEKRIKIFEKIRREPFRFGDGPSKVFKLADTLQKESGILSEIVFRRVDFRKIVFLADIAPRRDFFWPCLAVPVPERRLFVRRCAHIDPTLEPALAKLLGIPSPIWDGINPTLSVEERDALCSPEENEKLRNLWCIASKEISKSPNEPHREFFAEANARLTFKRLGLTEMHA